MSWKIVCSSKGNLADAFKIPVYTLVLFDPSARNPCLFGRACHALRTAGLRGWRWQQTGHNQWHPGCTLPAHPELTTRWLSTPKYYSSGACFSKHQPQSRYRLNKYLADCVMQKPRGNVALALRICEAATLLFGTGKGCLRTTPWRFNPQGSPHMGTHLISNFLISCSEVVFAFHIRII